MLSKYQKRQKNHKSKKRCPKKLSMLNFLLTAVVDIHEAMNTKQFVFTASIFLHFFLSVLRTFNTNKMYTKNNGRKPHIPIQIMDVSCFCPYPELIGSQLFLKEHFCSCNQRCVHWDRLFHRNTWLQHEVSWDIYTTAL
jgi:hypothetical protein